MKVFGVLLTVVVLVGALVGGVVGVLLPKISAGLSLGVLLSLFFGVVSFQLFLWMHQSLKFHLLPLFNCGLSNVVVIRRFCIRSLKSLLLASTCCFHFISKILATFSFVS